MSDLQSASLNARPMDAHPTPSNSSMIPDHANSPTVRTGSTQPGLADRDAEPARWEVEPRRRGPVDHFRHAVVDAPVDATEHEQVTGPQRDVRERSGTPVRCRHAEDASVAEAEGDDRCGRRLL